MQIFTKTALELKDCLKKLKSGKAPGTDLVLNEFLKKLPSNYKICLLSLFNSNLEQGKVPREWSQAVLCMMFKTGAREDPGNYRGIVLMNCITKVYTEILRKRLENWVENARLIPESQMGFRRNRGCVDAFYVLLSAIHLRPRQSLGKVYGLFVDFSRAFDFVAQNLLWAKLYQLGVSTKFIHILKELYDHATVQVKQNGEYSNCFKVIERALQGECLSPLLFVLFLADIENFFRRRKHTGLIINNVVDLLMLLYADNIVLLSKNIKDMIALTKSREKYCEINKLKVNTSKTKAMFF